MGSSVVCHCAGCEGSIENDGFEAPVSASAEEELKVKLKHIRRVTAGRSITRFRSISHGRPSSLGCGCLDSDERDTFEQSVPKVQVRGAIEFFEKQIAKESKGAAMNHKRHQDLMKNQGSQRHHCY